MSGLDEAWAWYDLQRRHNLLVGRLAGRYWKELPWEGQLGNDDNFRTLDPAAVAVEVADGQRHLDDLAVLVLFSAFEAVVRDRARVELLEAKKPSLHPLLQRAIEDALDAAEHGSFFRVLGAYKSVDADLVEMVNQVRRYRNWVAHGRRGPKPDTVDPAIAYDRLTRFLEATDVAAGTDSLEPTPPDGAGRIEPDTLGSENVPST